MLQCVPVCCSVLQCVAVCCSALQCTAFKQSDEYVLNEGKEPFKCHAPILGSVAVCYSVLHCVAVCCSVLHSNKVIHTC